MLVYGVQMMGLLADAFWTMGKIWPSLCPKRMSYGPKLPMGNAYLGSGPTRPSARALLTQFSPPKVVRRGKNGSARGSTLRFTHNSHH